MKVYQLEVGIYEANCYFAVDTDTNNAVVIDPGDEGDYILRGLKKENLTCKMILLTHGHADHTGAAHKLHEATGAPVYIHRLDADDVMSGTSVADIAEYFEDGQVLTLDSMSFKVIHTPGHTPGSCCFLIDDSIFTGDTLFSASCGRTDFPGGSQEQIMASLKKLADIEGNYVVFPGHMSHTTLERERLTNHFMLDAQGK